MTIKLTGIVNCTGMKIPNIKPRAAIQKYIEEACPGYYVKKSSHIQNKIPKYKIVKKEKILEECFEEEKGLNINFYV